MKNLTLLAPLPNNDEIEFARQQEGNIKKALNEGKFNGIEASFIQEALLFKNIRRDVEIVLNAFVTFAYGNKVEKAMPNKTRKPSSKKKFGSHGSQRHK